MASFQFKFIRLRVRWCCHWSSYSLPLILLALDLLALVLLAQELLALVPLELVPLV